MSSSIEITVNSQTHSVSEEMTLTQLLDHLSMTSAQKQGLALAVNQAVVPKSSWDDYPLADQDSILMINATQGG